MGGSLVYSAFARLSGLERLIERYPATGRPDEQQRHWQTVQVGPVVYRRCVSLVLGPQGLYLHVRPILSAFRPVLVPWSEFRSASPAFLHWRDARRLVVGDPPVGSITVYGRVLEDLRQFIPSVQGI
jgi:hypothetical protein